MDANDLANFVLEALKDMPQHDRSHFLERIAEEYCTPENGCGKPLAECKCEWPRHY